MRRGILWILSIIILTLGIYFGLKGTGPIPSTPDVDFSSWEITNSEGNGFVAQTDTSWVFGRVVYDSINDREDTIFFGPYKSFPPANDGVEYFPGKPEDKCDDRWVIETLGNEGCEIQVYGCKDNKPVLLSEYVLKGCNCGQTFPQPELDKKILTGWTLDGDSIKSIAIRLSSGDSISSIEFEGKQGEDIEYVNGHWVRIGTSSDSFYVRVDVNGKFGNAIFYPGKFTRAIENGKYKLIVVLNGFTQLAYVLDVDSPFTVTSGGQPSFGDLVDLQAHRINDTVRFVMTTYDDSSNTTYINIVDINGVAIGSHMMPGKFVKAKFFKKYNRKAFVTEDPPNHDGSGNMNVDWFDIGSGKKAALSPNGRTGKFEGFEDAGAAPEKFRIRIRDVDGNTNSQNFI